MQMNEEPGRDIRKGQPADDGYWDALFGLEENFSGDQITPGPSDEIDLPIFSKGSEGRGITSPENGTTPPETPAAPAEQPPRATDPWDLAHQLMEVDHKFELAVIGHNKGGLLVSWNGIQGFVPASQLVDFPQFHVPRERMQKLAEWQGSVLSLKLIEVSKLNSRLIFSERATLVAAGQREDLLNGVRPGDRRKGILTNLADFGAFVDLGGVEGLVHISEISWSRVNHPSAVLKPGQMVDVLVLDMDQRAGRVALSMKRLRPDPWLTAAEKYKPGQIVSGVVSTITTYGAFVTLEPELEGLVHISELAEGVFMHPRDVVQTGEPVMARVLIVEPSQKRIALSLRGTSAGPAARH